MSDGDPIYDENVPGLGSPAISAGAAGITLPTISTTQPPEPHHFLKHSDCSFTYADGPDPKEQELEDLRAQVRYLTAELEATQRRLSEAEDGDVFRPAYQRMRENFQVSMNTIRGLEDTLHSTQRELEETREQLRAARAAMRPA